MEGETGLVFRWGKCFHNKRRLLLAVMLFIVSILQSGCIKIAVEDKIVFRPDGSGTAKFTMAVNKASLKNVGVPIEEIRRDFERDTSKEAAKLEGTSRVREDDSWVYGEITFPFDSPDDLAVKLGRFLEGAIVVRQLSFSKTEETWLRTGYRYDAEIGILFRGDAAPAAALFEGWTHRVSLPGHITETNGTNKGSFAEWKITADEVVQITAKSYMYNLPVFPLVGIVLVVGAGIGAVVIARRAAVRRNQTWRCPKCGRSIHQAWKFCQQCGQQLIWTVCTSCGRSQLGDILFCTFCGASLKTGGGETSSERAE